MAWQTGFHAVNGFQHFVRDWRPPTPAGLPVLSLHGSLTQSGMWIAPAEAAESIRLLCPDQRGFGRSEDPGDDSCAAFASDAVALAQSLLPARYVVMGHSFASSIALDVALKDASRIAGVVLVDPVVRVGPPPAAPPVPPSPPESFATLDEAAAYYRETEEGDWPEAALQRFVTDILIPQGAGGPWRFPYTAQRLRRLRAFTGSAASDFDLFAKAKAARCPVLIFRGGMSKRFPEAAEPVFLAAFASKPQIVLCPASGHFPSTTEPGIVIAAVKKFLADLR